MKVLQILPELNSGGVERGTLELARYLVENGHQSLVISHGGTLVAELEAGGSKHLAHPVHRKSLFSLRHVPSLRKLFRTVAPDIIHVRSRVPAWLAWLAWNKMDPTTRPHFVTTVHGLYSVNAYSRIMTRGERVIAVSNSAQEYILANYPRADPDLIRVVPRGIDPTEYPRRYRPPAAWRQRWRSEHPGLEGKVILTLPARLTRLKGHPDFIEIVASLKAAGVPVHGLVAGGTHPRKQAYADELRALVAAKKLDEDLTFLGHRTDLREILAVSDAVLSLSTKPESFGRIALEALAMGIPVAGYDRGGVGELLHHFLPAGAIAPAAGPSALATLLEAWHRNGPPTPKPDNPFTLEAMLANTLAVYHELLP